MKVLHDGRAIIIGDEMLDLEAFPDLQVVGCPMTGTEHLPIDEIKKRGIKLITLRDFPLFLKSITSTAEHTFGLIIALMRNYKGALHAPYLNREYYKGHTLSGKTLGIIGYGRIGKQMKQIAEGFGMKVLTHDKHDDLKWHGIGRKPFFGIFQMTDTDNLEQLLRKSDLVSVHIPLESNEEFFTEAMFGFMKSSAQFINTSRSKVVQKGALLDALQNSKISGAAVDFIDDPELLEYAKTHDNLILTNHIGGMTFEDRENTDKFILQVVENFINKK